PIRPTCTPRTATRTSGSASTRRKPPWRPSPASWRRRSSSRYVGPSGTRSPRGSRSTMSASTVPLRLEDPRHDELGPAPLLPEPLEAVRELRTFVTLVRELGDEQRERLGVTSDPQRPRVHGIEPDVADQLSGNLLAPRLVPAVHEAGST